MVNRLPGHAPKTADPGRRRVALLIAALALVIAGLLLWRPWADTPIVPKDDGVAPRATPGATTPELVSARPLKPDQPRSAMPQFSTPTTANEATAWSLSGDVVRPDGSRVARARVRAGRYKASPVFGEVLPAHEAQADAQGTFTLELPKDWGRDPAFVSASSEDLTEASQPLQVVRRGEDRIQLVVLPSGHVTGKVHGIPSGGTAWVEAWGDLFPESPALRRVEVAPDGTFHLAGVRDTVFLQAACTGRARSAPWSGLLEGPRREFVELHLRGPGRTATVRVTDEAGRAWPAGTWVRVGNEGQLTTAAAIGADGLLTVNDLSDHAPLVVGSDPQWNPRDRIWWAPRAEASLETDAWALATPAEVRFPSGTNPAFRVVDGRGQVAADVGLVLSLRGTEATAPPLRAGVSEADGTWMPSRVAPLVAGEYRLALRDGRELWAGRLDAGAELLPVHVVLPSTLTPLTIRVEDARSTPIVSEDLAVVLQAEGESPDGPPGRQVDSRALRADGTTVLWGSHDTVEKGSLVVGFGEQVHRVAIAECVRLGPAQVRVRLPAAMFGALRAKVAFPSGVPAVGAIVSLTGPSRGYDLIADGRGEITHPWILVGTYRIEVRLAAPLRVTPAEVEVRPDMGGPFAWVVSPP
jgi:hypothetical protein